MSKKKVINLQESLIAIGISTDVIKIVIENGYSISSLKKAPRKVLIDLNIPEWQVDRIKDLNRKSPCPDVVNEVIFKSGKTCCICSKDNNPFILHHITEYNKTQNNDEANLVLICLHCHDDVHSKKKLSKNITPEMLTELKKKHEIVIQKNRIKNITEKKDFYTFHWDYYNTNYLEQLIGNDLFAYDGYPELLQEGVICKNGKIIFENIKKLAGDKKIEYLYNYNFLPINTLRDYHRSVIQKFLDTNNIELLNPALSVDEIMSRGYIGRHVILIGRVFFKNGKDKKCLVHSTRQNYKIEMEIDKFFCTSSSAIGHLSGNSQIAALIIIKSIQDVEEEKYCKLVRASIVCIGVSNIQEEIEQRLYI